MCQICVDEIKKFRDPANWFLLNKDLMSKEFLWPKRVEGGQYCGWCGRHKSDHQVTPE